MSNVNGGNDLNEVIGLENFRALKIQNSNGNRYQSVNYNTEENSSYLVGTNQGQRMDQIAPTEILKKPCIVKKISASEMAELRAAAASKIKAVLFERAGAVDHGNYNNNNYGEGLTNTMARSGDRTVNADGGVEGGGKNVQSNILPEMSDNHYFENKEIPSFNNSPNLTKLSVDHQNDLSTVKMDINAYPPKHRNYLSGTMRPGERITSLPPILQDAMEEHFLNVESVKYDDYTVDNEKSLFPAFSNQRGIENKERQSPCMVVEQEVKTEREINDYEESKSLLDDSIEMLRRQRERDHRERSQAPDRLHSISLGSNSAGTNSKNSSRRNSGISELNGIVEYASSGDASLNYPLAKTTSVPNMERRRSSLCDMFPGPSPLIVGTEPVLHTEPRLQLYGLNVEKNQSSATSDMANDGGNRENRRLHRTKTPPPVGVKLGVKLKKVTPPKTQITVKKNEAPMLGVVLRRVERKVVPQKSILGDETPLYKLSIVRGDTKDKSTTAKSKPKPANLQKSASMTLTADTKKKNPGGILTGPQKSTANAVRYPPGHGPGGAIKQRAQLGVPITIQKIEGDKIIIIKKFIIPKNGKIPEQYLKVGGVC